MLTFIFCQSQLTIYALMINLIIAHSHPVFLGKNCLPILKFLSSVVFLNIFNKQTFHKISFIMKIKNFITQTIFFAIVVTATCKGQYHYPATKTVDSSNTYFGVTYIDPAGYENGRLFYRKTMNTQATVADNPQLGWITLGTQGGPIPNTERSEPANLLIVNGNPWIVDCGDGAMERLAAVGFNPNQVNIAFISHLHMDHIGGLQALIGLRWFRGVRSKLTIYGPPGTDVVVSGILLSMKALPRVEQGPTPEELTQVVIVKDNSDLMVDSVRIRAVRNSHFDYPSGHPADNGTQSLSYRFDYKGYAIGYTGDTGPCDAVAYLEHGVDLLVSEVIDLPAVIAVFKENPKIPEQAKSALIQHFKTQHLTPQAAGKIAAEAGVGRLVFTHLSIPGKTDVEAQKLINQAHETFKGEVIVAHDLDRF